MLIQILIPRLMSQQPMVQMKII